MTAKEYLSQAYYLDREINIALAKSQKMRESLYGRGVSSDGVNVKSGASDVFAETIEKVIAYEEKANKLINALVDKKLEIETVISKLKSPTEREVLERRYLLYQPFESKYDQSTGEYIKGIAEMMGYSERQIYRIHGYALLNLNWQEVPRL